MVLVGKPLVQFPSVRGDQEIKVYGSAQREYPVCLLITEKDVEALISATAPLAEGAEWFGRLYNKEPGLLKVVLKP